MRGYIFAMSIVQSTVGSTCLRRFFSGHMAARIGVVGICLIATALVSVTHVKAQQMPVMRDNALIEAARRGDLQAVQAALAAGQSGRQLGRNGQTALHVASQWGQSAVVGALLEMPAISAGVIEKRAKDGHTALSYAVVQGHEKIVTQLLSAGADADRPGPNYEPPLIMATRLNHGKIIAALLTAKADIEATDATGRTAFDWARDTRQVRLIRQLQAAGAR